jgi:hypothetical protein
MEQCLFLEFNSSSANQEIPRIFWNPKVHYRIHQFPPTAYVPGQINPARGSPFSSLKIHFNITLTSMPVSFKFLIK